jgi:hypothetical protein
VEPQEIDSALDELENRLDRLRSLYEQYFMGIEKIEPTVPRKDVDRRFWILRRTQIRNTARRFRMQTLVQRYNTFQQHWTRICREIENGTYVRHLLKARKNLGAEPKTWAAKKRLGLLRRDRTDSNAPPADGAQEAAPANGSSGAASHPPAARDAARSPSLVPGPPSSIPRPSVAEMTPLDLDFDEAPTLPPPRSVTPPAPRPELAIATASQPQAMPAGAPRAPAKPPLPARPGAGVPRPGAPLPRPADDGAPTAPAAAAPAATKPAVVTTLPKPAVAVAAPTPPKPAATTTLPKPAVAAPTATALPKPAATATTLPKPAAAATTTLPRPAGTGAPLPKPAAAATKLPLPQRGGSSRPPAPRPAAPVPAAAAARPPAATPATAPVPAAARPAAAAPRPAPAAAPARPAAPAAKSAADLSDERVAQLHAELNAARRQLNQSSSSVSIDSLAKSLRETETKLKGQHGGRSVDFQVVIKDGKPIVKPVVRR